MSAITGVTDATTRLTAELARLTQETTSTAKGAANKAQGKDEMDDEDYVNIMVGRFFGEAVNIADEPSRDWKFADSPLDRLVARPSPLDRFGGD